jgi:predicted dehydrogenase
VKDKIRLGFIGAGWWATTNHMPILSKRDDVEMVGVASLGRDSLEKVKAKFGFVVATEDVDELLAQQLDGVVISSPHDLHAAHAIASLKSGAHVLVEKPVALSSADVQEIARVAETAERQVLVPYGWNYMPFLEAARDIVAAGRLGEIEYVLCHMASPTLGLFAGQGTKFDGWEPTVASSNLSTWQDPARGGGYAHGQITHSAALMFWLTDLSPTEVHSCIMRRAGTSVDIYDSASMTFKGGALGTISGAATLPEGEPYQLDIRIFGSDGVLLVDVERERVELRRHDGEHLSMPVVPGSGRYNCTEPPNRFIDLIKGNGRNNSDIHVAVRTVSLIEAMHRSAFSGRPVQID